MPAQNGTNRIKKFAVRSDMGYNRKKVKQLMTLGRQKIDAVIRLLSLKRNQQGFLEMGFTRI